MSAIQKRMEKMCQESQQLRRVVPKRYREILRMRRHYEHKISASSKSKQDFLDYIEYEKGVLKDLSPLTKPSSTASYIEKSICNRIQELYTMVTQRYRDDISLVLAHFQFCKDLKPESCVPVVINNMIKNYGCHVEIWQVIAQWYADKKDIDQARRYICKGLTFHKDSKALYKDAINLEISYILGGNFPVKEDRTELMDMRRLSLEKLQIYVKEILTHIKDYEYYIELLKYLSEHGFTYLVQQNIVTYLMKNFPNKAQTWNVVAQRDYKGFPNPMDNCPPPTTTKAKLTKCINRYKEGLSKVPPEEKEELWAFYINLLIDCRQEDHTVANKFKVTSLQEALGDAYNNGYLGEKHYLHWLDLADKDSKIEILQRGVNQYPQSVELWKAYLRTQILADNKQGIDEVFRASVRALHGQALPLWTGVIRYHLLSSDDDTMEQLYREGVRQPPEVSDVLKPEFIEWLAITKGMRRAREQYLILAKQEPYCKELHNTMSKLESTEIDFNFDAWEKVHQLACEQFGREDVDVWINWIQYYMDYRRGAVSKELFKRIHADAQNSLQEVLFLSFQDKYLSIMANITQ